MFKSEALAPKLIPPKSSSKKVDAFCGAEELKKLSGNLNFMLQPVREKVKTRHKIRQRNFLNNQNTSYALIIAYKTEKTIKKCKNRVDNNALKC